MKNILESVILNGNYNLNNILEKIDSMWANARINDEDREELISLARDKADVKQEINVMDKLMEHEARIKALEDKLANAPVEEAPTEVIEEFKDNKIYYAGDKILFKEKTYECTAPDGAVCVWNPDAYPTYWKLVEAE